MRNAAIRLLAGSLTLAVVSFSGWALLGRAPSNMQSAFLLEFLCGVGVFVSIVGLGVAILLFAMLPIRTLIGRIFQTRPPSKSN
jgi:hypothetical protein